MFTHSKKWARKIKKLHVAVVQQWLRNGQNSVMDMKRLLLCQSKLSCCCRGRLLLKFQYCCDPEALLLWVCEVTLLLSIKHIHSQLLASAEQSISGTWTFWLASILLKHVKHNIASLQDSLIPSFP